MLGRAQAGEWGAGDASRVHGPSHRGARGSAGAMLLVFLLVGTAVLYSTQRTLSNQPQEEAVLQPPRVESALLAERQGQRAEEQVQQQRQNSDDAAAVRRLQEEVAYLKEQLDMEREMAVKELRDAAQAAKATPTDDGREPRRCTAAEAEFQGQSFALARVRGCPGKEDIFMRLAQSMMPAARVFIDIGSNKGYTGARFYALWQPELGFTSVVHGENLMATSREADLRSCGACADCNEDTGPLMNMHLRLCGSSAAATSSKSHEHDMQVASALVCSRRKQDFQPIRVLSFDGNEMLVKGVRNAIQHWVGRAQEEQSRAGVDEYLSEYLPENPGALVASAWSVKLSAFTADCKPGDTLTFVTGGEVGHIMDSRDDLDKLSEAKREAMEASLKANTVVVPCTTVDRVVEEEGLAHVDVLKIDTEGHDLDVLDGAKATLRANRATLVMFEYNKEWPSRRRGKAPLLAISEEMAEMGYVCYQEGKNALVRITHCWHDVLRHKFWSNIYCVSHRKAPGLVDAFDSYSLAFSSAATPSP